jgi:hypothetical protein
MYLCIYVYTCLQSFSFILCPGWCVVWHKKKCFWNLFLSNAVSTLVNIFSTQCERNFLHVNYWTKEEKEKEKEKITPSICSTSVNVSPLAIHWSRYSVWTRQHLMVVARLINFFYWNMWFKPRILLGVVRKVQGCIPWTTNQWLSTMVVRDLTFQKM